MKYLTILALLCPITAETEQANMEWWMPGVFGYCTATDRAELGGCGKIEVLPIDWSRDE